MTSSTPWWRDAVIYQVYLPSFHDGNGDGIGDLEGLIAKLEYIADVLRVDAFWVGPFFRSPLFDQGYDVTNHCDVDPVFGRISTFDRLVAEAHRRGLKIITEYIPNHTSDQHPWFAESRSSRTSPWRDRYVWADPAPDGGPPNNWKAEIGGSSWELDEGSGQYYLHTHLPAQPDLNWRNTQVREAMLEVLRFWLARDVDGFRIDVVHVLMKDPQLRDNPPAPAGHANPYELQHPEYSTQLHVNDRCHPDVHDVIAEIRSVIGDRVTMGEIEAMDWEAWAKYYGEDLRGLHLPFAFSLLETPWDAPALREVVRTLEAAVPDGAWPVLTFGNHDRSRLASRIGRAQARVAAMLLLTLRGTPVLYNGDELAMLDQPVPRHRQRDRFGMSEGGVSHDPARTPMPWDATTNGGFSSASPTSLWLPTCADYREVNVAAQLGGQTSILNLYRALFALRRESSALRRGRYAEHPAGDDNCLVYVRQVAGERKLIALNLTDQPHRLDLAEDGHIVLSTALDRLGEPVSQSLDLRPAEGVVIETIA